MATGANATCYKSASPVLTLLTETTSTEGASLACVTGEHSIVVPSEAVWDDMRKQELFPVNLVNDSNIPPDAHQKALSEMYPELEELVNIDSLLPHLKRRGLLTGELDWILRTPYKSPEEKLRSLMCDLKGRGKAVVERIFLCFLDSHESCRRHSDAHFALANVLKRKALSVSKVSLEKQEDYERHHKCFENALKKIQPDIVIPEETAMRLMKSFGLNMKDMNGKHMNIITLIECWRSRWPSGSLEDLIRVLLSTKGLGKLVSGMFPISSSNPPIVQRVVFSLKEHWKKFALYLGYSEKEIGSITDRCCTTTQEIQKFLRVFRIPDLKKKTPLILQDIMELANVQCYSVELTHPGRGVPVCECQANKVETPAYTINNFTYNIFSSQHMLIGPTWNSLPLSSAGILSAAVLGDQPVISSLPSSDAESDCTSVTNIEESLSSRSSSPISMCSHGKEGSVNSKFKKPDHLPEKLTKVTHRRVTDKLDNQPPDSLKRISSDDASQKKLLEDKSQINLIPSSTLNFSISSHLSNTVIKNLDILGIGMKHLKKMEKRLCKLKLQLSNLTLMNTLCKIRSGPLQLQEQLQKKIGPLEGGMYFAIADPMEIVSHQLQQPQEVQQLPQVSHACPIPSPSGGIATVNSEIPVEGTLENFAERESTESIVEIQGTPDIHYRLILCYPTNQMPLQEVWVVAVAVTLELNSPMHSAERVCRKLTQDYRHLTFAIKDKLPVRIVDTKVVFESVVLNGFQVIPLEIPELTREEIDLRSMNGIPAHSIFQIEYANTGVVPQSVKISLNIHGVDPPHYFKPLLRIASPSPPHAVPLILEDMKDKVVERLHQKWKDLGRQLKLTEESLDHIGTKYADDISRCRRVIKKWIRNSSDKNSAVWQVLIDAITNTNEAEFAQYLQDQWQSIHHLT